MKFEFNEEDPTNVKMTIDMNAIEETLFLQEGIRALILEDPEYAEKVRVLNPSPDLQCKSSRTIELTNEDVQVLLSRGILKILKDALTHKELELLKKETKDGMVDGMVGDGVGE